MKAHERLSKMRLGLRLALSVIFLWALVVLAVTSEVIFGDLTGFERIGSLIGAALIWYVPATLVWFMAGGFRQTD